MAVLPLFRPLPSRAVDPRLAGVAVPARWAVVSIALFLLVWQLGSMLSSGGLLPGPVTVLRTLGELLVEPFAGRTLLGHIASSLGRWSLGFGLAVVIGVPLGILFGAVRQVRDALSPVFEFLRFIPPFAWIPLAILWLGAGQESAAFVVFIAAFPPVVISTRIGITGVDPHLLRAARNLGASPVRTTLSVSTPVAAPAIFTGIRVAVSNGWMAVVAAEMISGTAGAGFLIVQGQGTGNVPVVLTGMVAIGVTGAVIDGLIDLINHRSTRWRKSDDARA